MENNDNISRIASLPVIGSIATMPSRKKTFTRMIHSTLAQVDRLFVFLDGFDEIPSELLDQEKCEVTLLPEQGNLHASSRFLAPHLFDSDAIVVLFDDDILYPPDYVSRIRRAIARYGDQAIIGFHATIFLPPHQSYVRNRHSLHFPSSLNNNLNVHELGSGTAAFLSSTFRPDPATWRHDHMDDLYMAAEAVKANLKLIALRRKANWLVPLAEDQEGSIWQATKKDDRIQTEFMRYLLAQHVQPTQDDWWQHS